MRSSASHAFRFVLCVVSLATLASCGGGASGSDSAGSDSGGMGQGSAAAADGVAPAGRKRPDFAGLGEAHGCSLESDWPQDDWCLGYFGVEFKAGPSDLVDSLHALSAAGNWVGDGLPIGHTPASPTTDSARYSMRAIRDGREVALQNLARDPNEGVVMARFDVERDSPPDKRYGISGDASMELTYYLVVSDFDPRSGGAMENAKQARAMMKWEVFGITVPPPGGRPELKKMRQGTFRYCRMRHKGHITKGGGSFLDCKTAESLVRVQELVPAVERLNEFLPDAVRRQLRANAGARYDSAAVRTAFQQVLASVNQSFVGVPPGAVAEAVEILRQIVVRTDPLTLPAWLHCGAGCCTADDP